MHTQSFVVDFSSVSCFTAIPFFGLSSGVFGHSCRGEGGLNRGPPSLVSRYRTRQFVFLLFRPCVVPFKHYSVMCIEFAGWGYVHTGGLSVCLLVVVHMSGVCACGCV